MPNKPNLFEDKNQNGLPDFAEDLLQGKSTANVVSSNITFNVKGKTYNKLNELPPDKRAKVEAALQKINTIPFAKNLLGNIIPNQLTMNQHPQIPPQTTPHDFTTKSGKPVIMFAIFLLIVGFIANLYLNGSLDQLIQKFSDPKTWKEISDALE